jgi:hypothetical protein
MMRIETKRTLGLYRNCATRQQAAHELSSLVSNDVSDGAAERPVTRHHSDNGRLRVRVCVNAVGGSTVAVTAMWISSRDVENP